jgi:hypothetical protein
MSEEVRLVRASKTPSSCKLILICNSREKSEKRKDRSGPYKTGKDNTVISQG